MGVMGSQISAVWNFPNQCWDSGEAKWNYRSLSHGKFFCKVEADHDYKEAEMLQNSAVSGSFQKYSYY